MEISKLLKRVKEIAKGMGYDFLDFQENIGMVSFNKSEIRVNIYLTKMTIGTCLNHPKKGKTQLFRKNCTIQDVEKILKNPRTHSGKGYYTK